MNSTTLSKKAKDGELGIHFYSDNPEKYWACIVNHSRQGNLVQGEGSAW
jgi:hypothetical protein